MKKEKNVKKVLLKALYGLTIGFTIGVTLLMLSYVSVYFIAGEEVFVSEIKQLQNIKTLISQLLVIGVAYSLLYMVCCMLQTMQNTERFKNQPYKIAIPALFLPIIICLIDFLESHDNIYSSNIGTINIIISVIIFAISFLYISIKAAKDIYILKKINNKLEKNIKS